MAQTLPLIASPAFTISTDRKVVITSRMPSLEKLTISMHAALSTAAKDLLQPRRQTIAAILQAAKS